jgi:hypothetical protein
MRRSAALAAAAASLLVGAASQAPLPPVPANTSSSSTGPLVAFGASRGCVAPGRRGARATTLLSARTGNGVSSGQLTSTEQVLLNHTLSCLGSGQACWGVTTHFWITGGAPADFAVIRMYVDDEPSASIVFSPPMAAGVGFDDQTAPWSAGLTGKGGVNGAWFLFQRVPFYKNLVVTYQSGAGQPDTTVWVLVKGVENLAIDVGGVAVPTAGGAARLVLQQINATVAPLQFVNVVDVPTGYDGVVLGFTLAVSSGNLNCLEGCFHLFTPPTAPWPGLLLSTGTEDMFDSSFYFYGGRYTFPSAGLTHLAVTGASANVSAYRYFTADPLPFSNGAALTWRNGDAVNPANGQKCLMQTGGVVVGSPTQSDVLTYAWVYVWPSA